MWKILKYGLLGWIALSVVTAPLYWPYLRMLWIFNIRVAAPQFDPPSSESEARLQDVEYLATLIDYDRSFDETERVAFTDKLTNLRANVETLSDAGFYLGIAEAVALADNGHTNVSYRAQYTQFETIGARLYRFSDGVFIVSTAPEHEAFLGRKVLAIEGTPVDSVRERLRPYRGGNTVWRDLYSLLIVESPELLEATGLSSSPDHITMTLEADDGTIDQVRFAGRPLDDDADVPGRRGWQSLVPGGATHGFENWIHVADAGRGQLPNYLREPDVPTSYALPNDGLYIRALPGFQAGERSIKSVYRDVLAEHPDGSLDYLVVDFRLHDGGDYLKSMAFAKSAPDAVKPDGTVYIITGPNTFSAAIVTVAMLKYYSGDRAIIVGEEMGDREQFWAERGTSFRLPNSGYYINYATGYHDWKKGCKGEPYCFTMNEMHEVPAGSLSPEVVLTSSFGEYQNGQDVVLDWIESQQ